MEAIGKLFTYIVEGMKREFVIYGHTISLWQIYLFVIVASILCMFIGELIKGD